MTTEHSRRHWIGRRPYRRETLCVRSKTKGEVRLDDNKIHIFRRSAHQCHWLECTKAPCRGIGIAKTCRKRQPRPQQGRRLQPCYRQLTVYAGTTRTRPSELFFTLIEGPLSAYRTGCYQCRSCQSRPGSPCRADCDRQGGPPEKGFTDLSDCDLLRRARAERGLGQELPASAHYRKHLRHPTWPLTCGFGKCVTPSEENFCTHKACETANGLHGSEVTWGLSGRQERFCAAQTGAMWFRTNQ